MYLLIAIILSVVLGYLLSWFGPFIGVLLAFGIIVGCLFRGLYLLNDIHKRLSKALPKEDRVQMAYKQYLGERQ
jgi:Flp pilus assembly protein TadB